MSKSFRLSLVCTGLVAMMLGISQIAAAQLIISEFRVRGPNGANDEFIEIYNNSGADHTVAGGGTGYAVEIGRASCRGRGRRAGADLAAAHHHARGHYAHAR